MVIVVIQCLAVRDRRKAIRSGELEEGMVQTTSDEEGSELDSKASRIRVESCGEIGEIDDGKKL